jgi:hypothetical protein
MSFVLSLLALSAAASAAAIDYTAAYSSRNLRTPLANPRGFSAY